MTAPMPSMWTPLEQLPWKFAGRVTLDSQELYAWTRSNMWESDWHTIPVNEFWPKPKWKVSIREGSIISNLFGFLRGCTPQQRTFINGVDAFTAVHPPARTANGARHA